MPDVLVVGLDDPRDPGAFARLAATVAVAGSGCAVVAAPTPIGLGHRTIAPTLAELSSAVRVVSGVVVAGGTLGRRRRPAPSVPGAPSLATLSAVVRYASVRRQPVALLGIGTGDLRGAASRRLVRHLVTGADLMVLRDESSAARLAAVGVPTPLRVGSDPGWSMVDLDRPWSGDGTGVLVVLDGDADGDADDVEQMARALQPVAAAGCSVHVQPPHGVGGSRRARRLAERVGGDVHVVDIPATFDAAVDAMAGYRIAVTPTLGSLMTAAAAGTPAVAVAREPGVGELARRLGQRYVPGHASAAVLTRALMLGHEEGTVERDRVVDEVRCADEGADLLALLLDRSTRHGHRDFNRLILSSGDDR